MRKLDSDTKRIIDNYIEEQKRKLLFVDSAINNINIKYNGRIAIKHYFEISNYESDFDSIYDEDEVLRGLKDSLAEIRDERKNITLALQFADSKSKEYKEALKKLEGGY